MKNLKKISRKELKSVKGGTFGCSGNPPADPRYDTPCNYWECDAGEWVNFLCD